MILHHVARKLFAPGSVIALSIMLASTAATAEEKSSEPALGGHCPVSYFTVDKAVKGDPNIKTTYEGAVYHFSSEEAKKQFEADPQKYLPRAGGLCTTALGGPYANRFPGDPTVFDVYEGKLYLFSIERARLAYEKNPKNYIDQAEQRFAKPAINGFCVVSSLKQGKAVPGKPEFKAVHSSWIYHFADANAVTEFKKNPEKYLPQYENYCAVSVSNGKHFPADGTRLRVVEGKTYLVFDADAEKQFDADPAGIVKKADEKWPAVKAKINEDKPQRPKRP